MRLPASPLWIKRAEGGINFLDTADVLSDPRAGGDARRTEEIIGKWMQGKRESVVLATKCRGKDGDRAWDEGCRASTFSRRWRIACDGCRRTTLISNQTHSPDLETPIEETLSALDSLVQSGKVRYIGCSNYGAWRLAQALWASDNAPSGPLRCVQPRYNILFRQIEDELLRCAGRRAWG